MNTETDNTVTLPAEGLVDAKTIAAYLNISPSMITKLRKQGVIKPPVKIGASSRWDVDYLRSIAKTGLSLPEPS